MQKSLDQKLARILADPACRDFILADAKDADMAFGLSAPGRSPEHHAGEARFRTLAEYRQLMREIVAQGLVDIMLMSASSNEVLTIEERLFDNSHVTPAVRANDTTDIWLATGSGRYGRSPRSPSARPRSTTSSAASWSAARTSAGWGPTGTLSVTFNNDVNLDRARGSLQGVSHRGRSQRVPAFPGSVRSERIETSADRRGPVHQRSHRRAWQA